VFLWKKLSLNANVTYEGGGGEGRGPETTGIRTGSRAGKLTLLNSFVGRKRLN